MQLLKLVPLKVTTLDITNRETGVMPNTHKKKEVTDDICIGVCDPGKMEFRFLMLFYICMTRWACNKVDVVIRFVDSMLKVISIIIVC